MARAVLLRGQHSSNGRRAAKAGIVGTNALLIQVPAIVSDAMTRQFRVVGENDDVTDWMRNSGALVCCLPVTDGPWLVGLITGREIVSWACNSRAAPARHWRASACRAGDIMLREVASVSPQTSLREAGTTLLEQGLGCLPVLAEGNVLVGLLTHADFVRAVVGAQLVRRS